MARRQEKRLDSLTIKALTKAGRHADGSNLYLVVDKGEGDKPGAKRWVFLFRWEGKLREMGLGGFPGVLLAEARKRARDAQEVRNDGKNPIDERAAQAKADRAKPTFGEAADAFVESMKPQWRNEKHQDQWSMTLKTYAAPLRAMRVDDVDTAAVLDVLKVLWLEKPETASRLRGRIERVLDAAKAQGHRAGENPARWRGHLDHLLPKRQKLTRGHHAAMPYDEVAAFVTALRQREAVSALGLELLVLTAARSGEVMGATWGEIDLKEKVWTVPATRMKAGREHRVPLGERALAILDAVAPLAKDAQGVIDPKSYIFPGQRKGRPLSVMAFEMLLRRMKLEITVHGFRSSFRDWSGEVSSFPREVAEAALAHSVGDQTERAYRRGDALEKRREMMDAWAVYLGQCREPA
ncbi:tyrosine-type recombinase/integrase [Phenylobacterium sp.]|uniref:tyrosine-type recombinase/integrase n=1 Tax=Phenylobacterium sp. TaxID=1871053 RepID=UPI003BAC711A